MYFNCGIKNWSGNQISFWIFSKADQLKAEVSQDLWICVSIYLCLLSPLFDNVSMCGITYLDYILGGGRQKNKSWKLIRLTSFSHSPCFTDSGDTFIFVLGAWEVRERERYWIFTKPRLCLPLFNFYNLCVPFITFVYLCITFSTGASMHQFVLVSIVHDPYYAESVNNVYKI